MSLSQLPIMWIAVYMEQTLLGNTATQWPRLDIHIYLYTVHVRPHNVNTEMWMYPNQNKTQFILNERKKNNVTCLGVLGKWCNNSDCVSKTPTQCSSKYTQFNCVFIYLLMAIVHMWTITCLFLMVLLLTLVYSQAKKTITFVAFI